VLHPALRFLVLVALLVAACGGGGSGSGDDTTEVPSGSGLLIRWHQTSSVAGYVIHWGTVSGSYMDALDVGAPEPNADGVVSFLLEDPIAMGTIYFALTSYDDEYRMSPFSNELAAEVP
jgi:hypothetical protein